MRISPVGLGLILFFVLLTGYMLFKPDNSSVQMRDLLIAGIDFAERGGDQVSICLPKAKI